MQAQNFRTWVFKKKSLVRLALQLRILADSLSFLSASQLIKWQNHCFQSSGHLGLKLNGGFMLQGMVCPSHTCFRVTVVKINV